MSAFRLCALIAATLCVSGCDDDPPALAPANDQPVAKQVPAESVPHKVVFRDVADETGLKFSHFSGGSNRYYFPEIMSGGVALLDYDQDGDLDVYFAQGRRLDPQMPDAELRVTGGPAADGDRLFENRTIPDGQLTFIDVTRQAGIKATGYSMGIATGDVDNDGHTDLYVTRHGANSLLRNRGDGTFEDIVGAGGSQDERWNSSAAFVDFDGDGDLDLHLIAYVSFNLNYEKRCTAPSGRPDYCSPKSYKPLVDRLFRNDGDFKFTDITAAAGMGAGTGAGLGVVADDFDADGHVDLYVANDGAANFLWINQGDGTFTDAGLMSNTAYNEEGQAEASMGVVAGDYDNDGDLDLFMTHLINETNTLYRNDGGGVFTDTTRRVKLGWASVPRTGFGTVWLDFDNDGWLDLYITNGAVTTGDAAEPRTDASYAQQDQLFRNVSGTRFEEVSSISGEAMQAVTVGRGVAKGDLDLDGDIDLVISDGNAPARLLLNLVGQDNSWLRVRLVSSSGVQAGIGARVGTDRSAGQPVLWRSVRTAGSYLSASEPVAHFGLGDFAGSVTVHVVWADGTRETWSNIKTKQLVTLARGTGRRAD